MRKEAYFNKSNIPVYRIDYGVAEIQYDYNNGNLIRERYKDTNGQPTNRIDTGYALVGQMFEKGKLVKKWYEGYKNQSFVAVLDKITGVAGIEYRYDKGQIREEIYYNVNNELTLQKDIGCAIQECRYNEKGKLSHSIFMELIKMLL